MLTESEPFNVTAHLSYGRERGDVKLKLTSDPSAPAKQEEEQHDYKNQIDGTAAIVAVSGAHVIAAATDREYQDNQDDDENHADG